MKYALLIAALTASSFALAKPRPPPTPVRAKPTVDAKESSASLVARVKAFYASLEYDQVIPVAEAVLAREDLSVDQRLEMYRYYGSAKAIVEDPVDAEKPFRMLLRSRPEYDLLEDTPPKILAIFRKVQSEEKALAMQLREVERARTIAGLKLLGNPPTAAKGGRPLAFSFRLRDPTSAVESIRIPYRRPGQVAFSSLALQRSEEGNWQGQISGEFTADPKGFQLEYYVETFDSRGPLLSLGTVKQPARVDISAGAVNTAKPPPLPRWSFFTAAGFTAASGLTAAGLGVALRNTQVNYRLRASGTEETSGAGLTQTARTGEQLATATNAALVTAAVALAGTAVMGLFVNWDSEK